MTPEASRHRRRIGGLLISGRLPLDYVPETRPMRGPCIDCHQQAVRRCGAGRCAIHCDVKCDTHCERSLGEVGDDTPETQPMELPLCVICRRPNPTPASSACPVCVPPDEGEIRLGSRREFGVERVKLGHAAGNRERDQAGPVPRSLSGSDRDPR